jgi:tyrosine-protein phosphatase YwqE
MFKFLFKSKQDSEKAAFGLLKADMHSHLIPGIDDGAPDLETSLELIKGLAELGYTKLITTPHVMQDMYNNTREGILEKLEVLKTAVKENNLNIEIHAAAEYFLDDHVENLLSNKEPLLTIHDNMVLVEFSLAHPPLGLKEILFEMTMQDYQPVIAHPERYIYLERAKDFFDELKSMGCLFQLNILSLGNHYGKAVNDLAHYLIKKQYYELIGTDLHHFRHLDGLHSSSLITPVKKLLDSGKIINSQLV